VVANLSGPPASRTPALRAGVSTFSPVALGALRRTTLSVLLIARSLCLVPLVWFPHTLDQRNGRHRTRAARRAANRLWRARRAADLALAGWFPAAAPESAHDLFNCWTLKGWAGSPPSRPAADPQHRRRPGAVGMAAASERLTREFNLRVLVDDFGSGLSNDRRISEG
jgi:hypothetical protein